jgi:FSR family fosmidomycin resistance protein-like MFS transporter
VSLAESIVQPSEEQSPIEDSVFRPGDVITIAASHTVHDSYTGFVPVLLPSFVEHFALSNTRAGWLAAFTQLPSVLQPFFGHLADRFVLRWVVMLAPAVTATLMSLAGWAPNYLALGLLFTVAGLSSAAFHAVGSATAGRLSARHLGKGLSVWMVGGELGSALGPIMVAGVLTVLTLKGLSWLMVVGWLASFVLYLRLRNAPLHPVVSEDRPDWRPSLRGMRRVMLLMAGLVILRAMAVSAGSVFAPIFLKQEGSSGLVAGASVALFQAAGMVGTLGAGWMSDRVGRRAVLLFGVLVGSASLLLFIALDGWARFPFLALAGATTVSMHPVCMALVQETFPESRGLANALYLSTVFVISSGGAVVVGALGDSIGLRPAFVVAAVVTVLSVPLILVLPREGMRRRSSKV